MNELSQSLALGLASSIGSLLVPLLLVVFAVATFLKICIYYQSRRQMHFMSGLETHVHRHIDGMAPYTPGKGDFHQLVHSVLHRTYTDSEIWRPRMIYNRKEDAEIKLLSAVFMTDRGVRELMADTLKQVRYYNNTGRSSDWDRTSNYILASNPYFNKLFGRLSVTSTNRFLSTLPSIFIVVGILGTFLGIVMGLPALATLDPKDVVAAQAILGDFLNSMAVAMNSSVFGILLSVLFNILNATLSVNATMMKSRDKLSQSLSLLWQEAHAPDDRRKERAELAEKDRHMIESSAPGRELDEEFGSQHRAA